MQRPETHHDATRPGEVTTELPATFDAGLVFIGRLRTPFVMRADCPRQGTLDGPECRVEVDGPWHEALAGLEQYRHVELLYWMHEARRDLVRQSPKRNGMSTGTFSLRSPLRPNPIGTAVCALVRIEKSALVVRGLDCLDGTPLIDIKPHRGEFTPQVADKPAEAASKVNPWCASTGGS